MSIHVYAHWRGMTVDEKRSQMDRSFAVDAGDVGYLYEARRSDSSPARLLVPESFSNDEFWMSCTCEREFSTLDELYDVSFLCPFHFGAPIDVYLLEQRLPKVLEAATALYESTFHREVGVDDIPAKAYSDFVALAARKQVDTGSPVHVYTIF